MANHEFICDACKVIKETSDTRGHKCPKCGEGMRWNLDGLGIPAGDYSHVSDALAIHPSQTAEHNQLFPGVKVHPDGRIEFNSVKQQDNYLDKTGFVKLPQKIKNRRKQLSVKDL